MYKYSILCFCLRLSSYLLLSLSTLPSLSFSLSIFLSKYNLQIRSESWLHSHYEMDLSPYCVKKNTLCPAVCSVCTELAGVTQKNWPAKHESGGRARESESKRETCPMLHECTTRCMPLMQLAEQTHSLTSCLLRCISQLQHCVSSPVWGRVFNICDVVILDPPCSAGKSNAVVGREDVRGQGVKGSGVDWGRSSQL